MYGGLGTTNGFGTHLTSQYLGTHDQLDALRTA